MVIVLAIIILQESNSYLNKGEDNMFKIKDCKTFMDSIHGYVDVPDYFVRNIIDTDYF